MGGWVTSSLLPITATPQEQAIELSIARPLKTSVADLWNPYKCPAEFLPWLAWALSVDTWKAYWPENVKRSICANAIEIQRHKGTAKSVRDMVSAFGGNLSMREWFETSPQGEPHTFDVVLTLQGTGGDVASTEFIDDVIAEIHRTKPVRSHFTFAQGLQANAGIGLGAAARVAGYRRMQFEGVTN